MPRKTKEPIEKESNIEPKKTTTRTRKTASKTKAEPKEKKTTTKATATKKAATTKKTTTKSSTAKKTTTKKASTTTKSKATTTRKRTTKKATNEKKANLKEKVLAVEYYDLPYRYNQTVVKVLAQTPTNLFIYWDISDDDREKFKESYGDNFFENSRPILIVHNDTLGYSFEVEINDFANSWYLNVADSRCDYHIELGRRPIFKNEKLHDDYIYVTSSNEIQAPNDRVLLNEFKSPVSFRNVKTGQETSKMISPNKLMNNVYSIYDIYDMYKVLYKDINIDDFGNPSSGRF